MDSTLLHETEQVVDSGNGRSFQVRKAFNASRLPAANERRNISQRRPAYENPFAASRSRAAISSHCRVNRAFVLRLHIVTIHPARR